MNIKNYPERSRTYDFLGEMYAAKGDNANAIATYKKFLSIKETAEIRKKLEKLEEK
ncbi:MAG TPA: tetratricopeptide repeat protein [Puia sp.]|nr:tetratricopeptide repeat protein [Puia sp.]